MQPVFILSYPRSRTAWLAAYLTGAGIPCFHEAWREAKDVKALRAMMEARGTGVVVNADCSNWFFLDEIEQEFPDAKYVRIDRAWDEVSAELIDVFGPVDMEPLHRAYVMVHRPIVGFSIDCHLWTPDVTTALVRFMAGDWSISPHWHELMHRLMIQVTKDDVTDLLERSARGELDHLAARLKEGTQCL